MLGITGGMNYSTIMNIDADLYKSGPVVGLGYEVRFGKMFSFGFDFLYNQRGNVERYQELDIYFNITEETNSTVLKYISVPIKFGLVSQNKFYVFGNIGLIPSYLVSAVARSPIVRDGVKIGERESDFTDNTQPIDLSAMLEVGGGVKLGERLRIQAGLGTQIGFTRIYKYESVPAHRHLGFTFALGVKYVVGTSSD